MKTGFKICRQVAYSLFAVGLVLVIIATMMGASWYDASVNIVPGGWGWRGNGILSNMSVQIGNSSGSGSNSGKIVIDETYTDVTSLQFDFESAEVYIAEGESFSISVSGSGEEFTSKVTDGVWDIYSRGYKNRWGKEDRHYTVRITLPKSFVAKNADIYVGMGDLDADRLSAQKSNVNVGMGEIEIDKLISKDTEIICGMGSINVDGNLTGNTTIQCGMGDVEVGLTGKEEEYGYTATVGMGDVFIGKSIRLNGIAGEGHDGADRSNQLNIDCGMGSVKVSFQQD